MTDATVSMPVALPEFGEMEAMMRNRDWSDSPLGAMESWSPVLRSFLALVMAAKQPMFLAWGPDLCFLYNDGYAPILGAKHPQALGRPFSEVWSDIWPQISPIVAATLSGEAQIFEDLPIPMTRYGHPETPFFSFSYTPLRDDKNAIAGMFCAATETTAKVMAEREAADERMRLRQLFEQAPGFMCVLQGPSHVFEMTNAAYLQLVGHRDLVGMSVLDALPEVEGQGFFEMLAQVYSTGEAFVGRQLQVELQRQPDAPLETRYVDFVYQPILDAMGEVTGIFVEGSDVSENYAAQEALRRERDVSLAARMKADAVAAEQTAILAQLAEGVVVTDAAGAITFVNEAASRIHGVADLQVPPESYSERYNLYTESGEPYPFLDLPLARAVLEDKVVEDARWVIVRPDGTRVVAVGNARPLRGLNDTKIGAVLTLRDETARVTAEANLQELNETLEARVKAALAERNLLATLIETTDAFIQVVDLEYRILAINKAGADEFERVYGRRPNVGDTYGNLLGDRPEELAAVRALWARALAGEQFTVTEPFGDAARDRPYYEFKFSTLRDEYGERIGAYQFVYDVTERLRDQDRLRQAEEQLRQSQKMEAVGQLTGGIAHDFNNLLQGITGSLDVVQKRIAAGRTSELDRFISGAVTSANRAAALTHRLLAFSRRQPLDPKPVDANPLLASMEDLLRRTLGETIELELWLADGLWPTLCDANQLENAVLNLVINARDAMPKGGKLTITTENTDIDGRPGLSNMNTRSHICISVTDTGTGMSRAVMDRAFEPFFTTKPIGDGTGLGLSMIYGFARQSEGHAKIYSKVGQGTTVRLYLPRYNGEKAVADIAVPQPEAKGAQRGEVVVVVEDEPVVRGLIIETLSELGYTALAASDGPAGVQLLTEAERVDLLITDIGLPGTDGRQVADAARLRHPGLPVLFITGYAEKASAAGGFLEPGMSLLTKPFAMDTLAARIRNIIEGK